MELRLPAPCVIVLIGASSAGKSTWAAEHFASNEIVSSDWLRAMVGIDEDDQAAGTVAFDLLHQVVQERVRRKLTTVIDTTGLGEDNRLKWIQIAHDGGLSIHAVLFPTPAAVCEQRNSERRRPIPKSVLAKQLSRFDKTAAAIEEEPFDGVLKSQPVAVVTPQVAEAAESHTAPTPTGHTFGLILSRFDWPIGDRGEQVAAVARRAEAAGFRDIWLMDHFRQIRSVGQPWEDLLEVYTTLGFIAAHTERIRLGAMVTAITHRNPAVLGKMIATLDVLSGGRAVCGLGTAWDRSEHDAYGIDFPPLGTRYDMLEDTLEMLPLLWGKGSPSFSGRVLTAQELVCYPRPVQTPIPVLVGGGGEKRTLRVVARHADAANLFGAPNQVAHKVEVLRRHLETEGRSPDAVEVTHLTGALVATDRSGLRERVNELRDRTTSFEDYSRRNNAGTVDDLVSLFTSYHEAGATHSIVSLPDVALPGSVETFAEVIEALSST